MKMHVLPRLLKRSSPKRHLMVLRLNLSAKWKAILDPKSHGSDRLQSSSHHQISRSTMMITTWQL